MFVRLFLAFTLVPFIELYLLLKVGGAIGAGNTILLIVVTGVVGAWLARLQGLTTLRRVQHELDAGRMPADALVEGVLIFAAGLLLLTPGLLTDSLGFFLLVPAGRRLVRRWLRRWFARAAAEHGPTVITVEGWRDDT